MKNEKVINPNKIQNGTKTLKNALENLFVGFIQLILGLFFIFTGFTIILLRYFLLPVVIIMAFIFLLKY